MQTFKMNLDWKMTEDELKKSVLDAVEIFSDENSFSEKDSAHLRLAAEETMEMVRLLDERKPEELSMGKKEDSVILRLITDSRATDGDTDPNREYEKAPGITGKLRMLYESGYEGLERDRARAEEIGVRKAEPKHLKKMGFEVSSDAYVWSLQSYNLAAFEKIMEDNEEGWQEISHSILANLSEDIRLFIFRDKVELDVLVALEKAVKTDGEKYAISPEFKDLFKVPVVKTAFQVKMVQLMFKGLPKKQRSKENLEITDMKFSSAYAKKGCVRVLKYHPYPSPDKTPTIVFFHGGADLFPAMPYHYRLAEKIAVETKSQVFMVMYDLAPEYNPPVQIREGFDVFRQLLEQKEYHVYPDRVAVMGDSSGGTMTAALTLMARDGLVPMPKGQLLLYPSLDMRFTTASMKKYTDVPVINADAINAYRKIIHTDWSEGNKYYQSPAEADSFKGLCDTYIETAEFDALHDEGVEYARALEKDGVNVILNETKGTVHCFDMAENSSILMEAMNKRIGFINDLFN